MFLQSIAWAPQLRLPLGGAVAARSTSTAVFALTAAWMCFGLFGHDPWKPDEAYTLGLVHHIVKTGDWVVPTLAGEPFLAKPPPFFITGPRCGPLLHACPPPPTAAR